MPKGYKWERGKRGNDYIPPLLSEKDEYVPKTHIGMYSIFRNKHNTSVYMSESACQKIRMQTYKGILELYEEYGSPNYAKFFNVNREEINDVGLNAFASHPKIAPVAGLIECFETLYRLKSNGRLRTAISFGINKRLLEKYFDNVRASKLTGKPVEIPKLKRADQKDKNIVIFGEERFRVVSNKSVKIERNALYEQFKHWCILQGVEEKEGFMMALESLIERYPTKGLANVGDYRKQTIFDSYVYIQPSQEKPVSMSIKLDGTILALAEKIIERYNADPDNIAKPYMDIHTYANNALHLLNSKMDLKYRNPELYRERKNVEAMQIHNEIGGDEFGQN